MAYSTTFLNAPQIAIPQALQNSSASTLSFPGNIQNAAYYSRLTFKKYNRARTTDKATTQVTATVILPIPENFGDTQKPSWYFDKLGILGSDIDEIKKGGQAAFQAGSSIYDQFKDGNIVNGSVSAVKFAGLLAAVVSPASMRDGKIQQRLSQQFGVVINPHLSLMFDGMALRQHNFNWKFAPRNAQEASTLGQIISTIRQRSLPSYNAMVSKFALDYPDTVEIEFVNIDTNFKTKVFKSAITNVSTNLGPSGIAFFPKGVPVETELSISLVETEIVVREDFANNNTTSTTSR